MYLRPRTVGRLPCVKGAVGRRLTEGSAKAFLLNRVLSKHPALSIPPSRLRRATSLYAREAASGGGGPLIRPGLRPVHLPRRGRLPPAGEVPLIRPGLRPVHLPRGGRLPLAGGKTKDHRQDMTGHLPLRSSKRFTGGYQFSSTVPVRPWRFLATLM